MHSVTKSSTTAMFEHWRDTGSTRFYLDDLIAAKTRNYGRLLMVKCKLTVGYISTTLCMYILISHFDSEECVPLVQQIQPNDTPQGLQNEK